MSEAAADPHGGLNFPEARRHVLAALDAACDLKNDARFAGARASAEIDIRLAELGLDSMYAMELSMEIEARTGVEVDLADLASSGSVNRLAELLTTRAAPG